MSTKQEKSKSTSESLYLMEIPLDEDINNESNIIFEKVLENTSRKRKMVQKTKKYSESSDFSDASDEEMSDRNKIFKIKFNKRKVIVHIDSLEKENKSLKEEVEVLKSELQKLKHENNVLREANIQFQVKLYDFREKDKEKTINTIIIEEREEEEIESESLLQDKSNEIVIEERKIEQIQEGEYDEEDENNSLKIYLHETQEQIQQKYKFRLNQMTLDELNEMGAGEKNDSKFLNHILPIVFDRKTLLSSSVTGKAYTNRNNHLEPPSKPPLDPRKLGFVRSLFLHRINNEDCVEDVKESRIKKFHNLVGNKISNLKLSQRRKTIQKN